MFIPCIVRLSRNNQQYALIYTAALFYILAPTCFDSSLPSSGSFQICLSDMKIQIDLVVYHIMLVKWPECQSVVVPSMTLQHTGHVTTHYMIYHQIDLYFDVTQTDPEAL
jgi:hypothetical protein